MLPESCSTCGLLSSRGPSFPWEAPHSPLVLELLSVNTAPDDSEVDDLRRIERQRSASVECLQAQISKAEETLSTLRAMHATASEKLGDIKIIFHPIRYLPRDILEEIFFFCTPVQDDRDLEDYFWHPKFDSLNPRNHPWNLSHVSRLWRNITLSLPRLWSTVYLDFEHYESLSYRQCMFKSGLVFERSASLDLDITLSSGMNGIEEHPMTGFLESSTTRWRTLYSRIPTSSLQAFSGRPFPLLQELSIAYVDGAGDDTLVDTFSDAPNIRTVNFFSSCGSAGQESSAVLGAFPWNHVTKLLSYSFLLEGAFRSVLQQATNVEDLTLMFGLATADFRPTDLLYLPSLKRLDVIESDEGREVGCVTQFLNILSAPLLRHLTVTFYNDFYMCFTPLSSHSDLHRITDLFIDCCMSAKPAAYTPRADYIPGMLKFLRLMHGVENFHLKDENMLSKFLQSLQANKNAHNVIVLPSLQELDLHRCQVHDAQESDRDALLLLIVQSRRTCTVNSEASPGAVLQRLILPEAWRSFEAVNANRQDLVSAPLQLVFR